ncbi:MAG TPA: PA2169 family four-helix-bundle protein [Bryobacteraceae bacterium]|jgi:uncharacterized protein (TIGR02284 family)|nr:PA2169 family four-helix-bundle protein [Bryobacteraceae bacterium]
MPDEPIHLLNHLVQINKDAEAGFLTAAQNIQNSELESLFASYAKQHAKFAAELQDEIERRGGTYSDSGTVGGALHRGWLDLKSTLSGHSAGAILASCDSGEESAEAAYSRAADAHPSGQTNALIEKHLRQIQQFRTHLCRLIGETKDGIDFQKNE